MRQQLAATLGQDPMRPVVLVLFVASLLFGIILVAGIGTATVISQFAPPPLVGWMLIGIALLMVVSLATEWRLGVGVAVLLSGWLWIALTAVSLLRVSSAGAIASFATFGLVSLWVLGRLLQAHWWQGG